MALKTETNLSIQQDSDTTTVGHVLCTAPISFGGSERDDQWLYFPDTKQFDLSRGAEQRLAIACDENRHNHCGFIIDPGKSILIVVDMQNYFIHPMYRNHAAGLAVVNPTLSLIGRCRDEGIQIAFLNWGLTNHDLNSMAPAVQRGFSKSLGWHVGLGAQLPDNQGRCLFKRTWNAELYDPLKAAARPGDLFFDKTRMSGLWSTNEPFHVYLRSCGKKTLIFAGVNTDKCVGSTISDAYSWGWDCIMVSNCTGTMTDRNAQDLTEYNVATNMGFVTTSKAFIESEYL